MLSMTDIRRYPLNSAPVFITAVCHQRRPVLVDAEKQRLLDVMREVKEETAYRMLAYVILDDHFHALIQPEQDCDLSRIIQSVKLRFTHRHKQAHGIMHNVILWQRRFWDHHIRDDDDQRRHLDYIHYNPVRHGYVAVPARYRWSSMAAWIERGTYSEDWGAAGAPSSLDGMESE